MKCCKSRCEGFKFHTYSLLIYNWPSYIYDAGRTKWNKFNSENEKSLLETCFDCFESGWRPTLDFSNDPTIRDSASDIGHYHVWSAFKYTECKCTCVRLVRKEDLDNRDWKKPHTKAYYDLEKTFNLRVGVKTETNAPHAAGRAWSTMCFWLIRVLIDQTRSLKSHGSFWVDLRRSVGEGRGSPTWGSGEF